MDQNKKRDRPESSLGAITDESNKRGRTPPEDEDDEVAALLNVGEEDAFADLWKLLEGDTASTEKIRFVTFPLPAPTIFRPSDAYITINGNDESCGSSFSECDSSVMASFDLAGISVLCSGAWGSEARGEVMEADFEGKGTDGCDLSDEFDGMLARFLGEDVYEQN